MYEVMGIKAFCCYFPVVLMLFGLCLRILIPLHAKQRRREKMKLLALLGTPVCRICKAEVAKFSNSKDPEAHVCYCYECLLNVQEATALSRASMNWQQSNRIENDLIEDVIALYGDALSSFGSSIFTSKYKTSVKIRKKRKKSRRKA